MSIRIRTNGRIRKALPTVLAVAFGVSQVLGGGGFTDQATLSGSSASTATLVASTPAATSATATSIDLAWDAVAAGNTPAEFTLQRSATADGANPSTVYTGPDASATDLGNIPMQLVGKTITVVGTGTNHSCAVADSTAYCWGNNTLGQLGDGTATNSTTPVAVTGLTGKTITALSLGYYSTCAIADGAAYCWGNNYAGELGDGTTTNSSSPVAVTGLTGKTITTLSLSYYSTCAIADGAAYCWGNNSAGQLGDGTTTNSTTPVAVTGLTGKITTAISSGMDSSCAVADGAAYCWGGNYLGKLGSGTTTNSTTPVAVTGLTGTTVTAISVGYYSACAIADGTAYCWGGNLNGLLGTGTTTNSITPVAVTGLAGRTVTAISVGWYTSCAIADDSAFCWGYNGFGQLGVGTTTGTTSPVTVTGLAGKTVTAISTHSTHACAVADGAAYCWGENLYGQLGNSSTTTSHVSVAVTPVGDVSCGPGATVLTATTCSLAPDTTYYYRIDYGVANWTAPSSAWVAARSAPVTLTASTPSGSRSGATSLDLAWTSAPAGSTTTAAAAQFTVQRSATADGTAPTTVYTGTALSTTDGGNIPTALRNSTITAISTGLYHSCAIADAAAYCWGDNYWGQLGTGTTGSANSPNAVSGLTGKVVTAVSTGFFHSCAIADGALYCWGYNFEGELGDGTTTNSSSPVAVSGLTGKTITAVSTGRSNTCAIADGALYCWGGNGWGQLGDGTGTGSTIPVAVTDLAGKTVTAVSSSGSDTSSGEHTCAIADAITYCWGYNGSGQLGDGTHNPSSIPVAVVVLTGKSVTTITLGEAHTCAIADGTPYCWGDNTDGELGNGTATGSTTPVPVTGFTGKAVTGISAAGNGTCALADGSAYCWGSNTWGQIGDGTTADATSPVAVTGLDTGNVTAITHGHYHSCALVDGAESCWGYGFDGQLGGSAGYTLTPVAVTPITGVGCEAGATLLTATTCSLTPDTTYYYRVDYTVGSRTSPAGLWTALATSP